MGIKTIDEGKFEGKILKNVLRKCKPSVSLLPICSFYRTGHYFTHFGSKVIALPSHQATLKETPLSCLKNNYEEGC